MMASAIADGVMECHVDVEVINARTNHITHLATEALDASAIAAGSPTLNKTLMPTMAAGRVAFATPEGVVAGRVRFVP